jgi:hypothetical protein
MSDIDDLKVDISGMPVEEAIQLAKNWLLWDFAITFNQKHGMPGDRIAGGVFDDEIRAFIADRDRKLEELRARLLRKAKRLH